MNRQPQQTELGGHRVLVFLPDKAFQPPAGRYPVLYANDGDEIKAVASQVLEGFQPAVPFIWVAVAPNNRNDEYTPWPAPGLQKNRGDFGGRGRDYLAFLEQTVKPWADRTFPTLPEPCHTGLMGYSLGGLSALDALFVTKAFGCAASLSGSLWYDGFAAFVDGHVPQSPQARVYLSLGKGEGKSRNRRLAAVQADTLAVQKRLSAVLEYEPTFVWQEGGHFSGIPSRFQDALAWFAQMQEERPAL